MKTIWNKLKSVDYLLYLAKWFGRVDRCRKATDPALVMGMFAGGTLLCMIVVMGSAMTAEHPTLWHNVWLGLIMFIYGSALGFLLVYGLWEFSQGYKWIRRWAVEYQNKKGYYNVSTEED